MNVLCVKCGKDGEAYARGTRKNWCKKCVHRHNYETAIARHGKEARFAYLRNWKRAHKATVSIQNAEYRQRLKRTVIDRYGGKCACCGEANIAFLTVDHKNNDGKEHRKTVPGSRLLNWLIKNCFPAQFQILCFNCNCAKAQNKGVCPHVESRRLAIVQ